MVFFKGLVRYLRKATRNHAQLVFASFHAVSAVPHLSKQYPDLADGAFCSRLGSQNHVTAAFHATEAAKQPDSTGRSFSGNP